MGREIIALIHASEVALQYRDILQLNTELDKITSPKEETQIDLLLNSWGGDPHAAYKAILLLRSHCNSLNVVVPFHAKSAATLMCLGADKLYMNGKSELGPLDAQMEHPHVQGVWVSAHDEVNALDYLQYISQEWAKDSAIAEIAPEISRQMGLRGKDALELALLYTSEVLKPVMEQIDPLLINMSYRNLEMTEKYGQELLMKYMLRDRPDAETLSHSITHELVWSYPEHGYVIGINEARRLQIVVEDMSNLANHEELWQYYIRAEEHEETVIKLITREILSNNASERSEHRDSSSE